MEKQEIYTRLTTILRDVFDDDTLIATPELTAADVKDWDSVAHITLVVAIEQEFGIKFNTAELEKMKNVGHMATQIEHKLASKAGR